MIPWMGWVNGGPKYAPARKRDKDIRARRKRERENRKAARRAKR